jgi:hypothetical protein
MPMPGAQAGLLRLRLAMTGNSDWMETEKVRYSAPPLSLDVFTSGWNAATTDS